jgi:uncharacterized protein (TIGR03067 family)
MMRQTAKWQTAVALAAVCLLAASSEEDANKADIAKWQGTWRATSMENDGKPSTSEQLQKIKLTVEGTSYHFQNGTFSEHGTYNFAAAKNPKELDITAGDGADKGKVYLVIYKVDGDDLTICLQADNKARPHEFTGRAGSGCVIETWKRVKP